MRTAGFGLLAGAVVLSFVAGAPPPPDAGTPVKTAHVVVASRGNDVWSVMDGDDLASGNAGAWMGVRLQELNSDLREALDLDTRQGVLVSDVVHDGPAEAAGIESGDVILRFDDRRVRSVKKLKKLVAKREPGDEVEIEIFRDGKTMSKKITLGERAAERRRSRKLVVPEARKLEFFGGPRLGVIVQPMNQDLSAYFDVDPDEGVLVLQILEDSPAEKAEIRGGDVIVRVEDHEVSTAGDIREALEDYEGGDEVRLDIVREGRKKEVRVELEEGPAVWYSEHDSKSQGTPWFHGFQLPHFEGRALHLDDKSLQEEMEDLREDLEDLREELEELRDRS